MTRAAGSTLRTSRTHRLAAALGAAATLVLAPATGRSQTFQSEHHDYRVSTVVEGLANPWGMAFLPGGDLLVTERPGRLRLVRDGVLQPAPIAGVPEVFARGQGGLLDVALHPQYEQNRLVYLAYSKPGPEGATTAIIRARFDGSRLAEVEEVFEAVAWAGGGSHFGSRMAFDRDGYLFFTVGDRGVRPDPQALAAHPAQDLGNHQGTVIRLHDDGRVPTDNPFVGRADARPEIWSYGHRTPQGLVIHPETGELWETEHGPQGGDELNLIVRGANYGWPMIGYGVQYGGAVIHPSTEREGMEQPVHHWTPSIATSGLTIYAGDAFPRWRGHFFSGALAGQHVARVVVVDGRVVAEEKLLDGYGRRIRDVRTGPDGYLYLLTDHPDGSVVRLEPVR
jgi:aldose sugar dehydrogenase